MPGRVVLLHGTSSDTSRESPEECARSILAALSR
jgi:hypothetical protein